MGAPAPIGASTQVSFRENPTMMDQSEDYSVRINQIMDSIRDWTAHLKNAQLEKSKKWVVMQKKKEAIQERIDELKKQISDETKRQGTSRDHRGKEISEETKLQRAELADPTLTRLRDEFVEAMNDRSPLTKQILDAATKIKALCGNLEDQVEALEKLLKKNKVSKSSEAAVKQVIQIAAEMVKLYTKLAQEAE